MESSKPKSNATMVTRSTGMGVMLSVSRNIVAMAQFRSTLENHVMMVTGTTLMGVTASAYPNVGME